MAFTTVGGTNARDATSFIGTVGIDTIKLTPGLSGPVFLNGRQDNDVIQINTGGVRKNDSLAGGEGSDTFISHNTSFLLSLIQGGGAADSFGTAQSGFSLNTSSWQGNDGRDTLFVASAVGSTINGNQGLDTITISGDIRLSHLRGGSESDSITIGNNSLIDSLIQGDAGEDEISISTNGSNGKQVSNSTIDGGVGSDTINGADATAPLLLSGGADADTIAAGNGADTLEGGHGNDSLQGNGGADQLKGGEGDDQMVYSTDTELFSDSGTLIDQLIGDTGLNAIAINNNLTKNNGNTTFTITTTDNFATNFSNIQTIRAYGSSNQSINISLIDSAYEAGLRNLDLSADTDQTATNTLNVATAGAGENFSLIGSSGADAITGGSGMDTASGGAGNDTITGGTGIDRLTGGLGSNRFIQNANDSRAITNQFIANQTRLGTLANNDWLEFSSGLVDVAFDFDATKDVVDTTAIVNRSTEGLQWEDYLRNRAHYTRGNWDGESRFTVDYAGGNDILFLISLNGANLAFNAFDIGVSSIILLGAGSTGFTAANII